MEMFNGKQYLSEKEFLEKSDASIEKQADFVVAEWKKRQKKTLVHSN